MNVNKQPLFCSKRQFLSNKNMICLRLLLNVSKGKSFVDHTDKGAKLCLGFLFINFPVGFVSNDRYDKQQ